MLTDKFQKIKLLGNGKNSKKKTENLAVFLVILIITFIAINKIWNNPVGVDDHSDPKKMQEDTKNKQLASEDIENLPEDTLQKNLENILSKISGVGRVNVLVTYSESSQIIPLYDETTSEKVTEEADTSGGKRTTTDTSTQKSTIMQENNGEKNIITQKTVSPKIEGAIVIADGGGNATVKEQIISAVEAATGLATHKIQVFKMN